MTIDVSVTANSNIAPAPFPRDLYEEQLRDIERFEIAIEQYLAGEITEDVFRVMRLNNGIYGQRQGGTNQMVRIKLPAGSIRPDQLELMAELATDFSRGWGHITTRQNIQFHFVELRRIPDLLRKLAAVGLTSREACGDTVRNVMACHLAGACPHEKLDVTPWAEATFRHFVRNPIGQRLPRKFKVNFSGCSTDCGQAMFNDVGVVAHCDGPRQFGDVVGSTREVGKRQWSVVDRTAHQIALVSSRCGEKSSAATSPITIVVGDSSGSLARAPSGKRRVIWSLRVP